MPRPMSILRWEAVQAIEEAATQARDRYITPGQDIVYVFKAAQARAYLTAQAANPATTVPAYVAAEAVAANCSALEAAQSIATAADAFHGGPGPAIEQARRAAKLAIQAAQNPATVQQVLNTALAALQAI